ncbi:PD-(D/E)XK nuclease-like domain-containing protein [Hydrogenimonas thermophila]|uniref:Putative exodeoxyribonuclease 8 PDDEXK-like domain-containing protein n=1 Tax=Hydrogenimonas thermophila TaxID=223786 RepID=A0A1I5NQB6_9BACT|nr:PD-(D/E)XK nuclease-like domain-containing protein [Hydrogenimonas thermophila]SFP23922.1 PDDEXK-like protein of unknown function [Hydrogenimonas thermophila]
MQQMSNAEYRAKDGISSSDFRLLELSPLHYVHRERFKLEGKQFDFGTLLHAMVLEPETLSNEFVKEEFDGCRENKNSKKYREAKAKFLEENAGKQVVAVDEWETAERMAENIRAIAGGILSNGVAERSIFAKDDLGFTRKCRPDYYLQKAGIVIDIKTTKSVDPYSFEKAIYDYRYHRQAAWYLDTLKLAGYPAETFIIVAVEKQSPYLVRIYQLEQEAIEAGRENYLYHLERLKKFLDTGVGQVAEPISLPAWYWKQESGA